MGTSTLSNCLLCVLALLLISANASARRPGGGGNRPGGGSNRPGSGSGGGKPGTGTGGQQHTYPPSSGWSGTTYRPPQQIKYGSNSFPVSQTSPPIYVYQIRDSGSRYNNLLTGLALWNLGRLSRPTSTNQNNYQGTPGEVCKFRLSNNGTTEDRLIDCKTISSFIWEWENQANGTFGGNGTTGGNSTVGAGTEGLNSTEITVVENDGGTNSTAVMDALEDKGESILVTPEMSCYIIRILRTTTTTQSVDCELLQLYTANSWRNSAGRLAPALFLLVCQVLLFQIL